jgi:hypothetical protein
VEELKALKDKFAEDPSLLTMTLAGFPFADMRGD